MELWNQSLANVNIDDLKGCTCWGGLDLSSKNDITGLILVFYNAEYEKFIIYPFLFTPGDNAIERGEEDGFDYQKYITSGDLIGTRGRYVNFEDVLELLYAQEELTPIDTLGFDRWGSTTIINRLEDKWNVVPLGQGTGTMTPAINDFENLLIDGRLIIHNNEVFNIMAKNVVAVVNDGGTRYSKTKSEFKIDGIIAMLMGLSLAVEANGIPKYDAVAALNESDWG